MKLDLLLVALLCGITLALEPQGLIKRIDIIDVGGLAIMGTAVSILLALRNSEAISRWWEARTPLGSSNQCEPSLARLSAHLALQ